jgi:hypothetical protein
MDNKAKMRVKIARDVLKQLTARKLVAAAGVYMILNSEAATHNYWKTLSSKKPSQQLNKFLPKKCNVCALGALFITAIDKNNDLTLGELPSNDISGRWFGSATMRDYLNKWFDLYQLVEIEQSFERGPSGKGQWSTDKMKSIMENIIKNKGTFVS